MSFCERGRRRLLASILLVAFVARALIPPGFMPGDRPFSIEICWEGFPAEMLAHPESPHADSVDSDLMDMDMDSMSQGSTHLESAESSTSGGGPLQAAHHHSRSSHSEHCVFGTACSAGPTPHLPLLSDISSSGQLPAAAYVSSVGTVRLVHLPQPRAPPGRPS